MTLPAAIVAPCGQIDARERCRVLAICAADGRAVTRQMLGEPDGAPLGFADQSGEPPEDKAMAPRFNRASRLT